MSARSHGPVLITRISGPLSLDGDTSKKAWQEATATEVGHFPWYRAGRRQKTIVRTCYDDRALYILFECEDRHSHAQHRGINSAVHEDSCVEFFASVAPDRRPDYVNLEINCCGVALMGYGADRSSRRLLPEPLIARVGIYHSIPGPTKQESPDDSAWVLEVALPFDLLTEITGEPLPKPGAHWRGNFYRCGGRTDPQYACWSPISAPKADFHRPEQFGPLVFEH